MSVIPPQLPQHSGLLQQIMDRIEYAKRMDQGKRFPGANPQGGEQVHPTFDMGSLVRNKMLFPRINPQDVALQNAIQRRVGNSIQGNQVF